MAVGAEIGNHRDAAGHDERAAIRERFTVGDHIDGTSAGVGGGRDAHIHSGTGGAVNDHRVDGQIGAAAGDVELGKVLLPVSSGAGDVEDHFLAFVAGVGCNV